MSNENLDVCDLILLASLPHVVFEGWTKTALQTGIDDLREMSELDPIVAERAFPGGMTDMARHFSNWADRRMVVEMAKLDMSALKVRERIAAGVRTRLQVLAPHREAVRALLTFLSLPQHVPMALSCGYNTVSEIWYAAGDQSADVSFYTKRALLAPVLATTTLYWLADDGDGAGAFPETWAFLDRRIADVLKIPPLKSKLMDRLTHFPTPTGIVRRFAIAAKARRSY